MITRFLTVSFLFVNFSYGSPVEQAFRSSKSGFEVHQNEAEFFQDFSQQVIAAYPDESGRLDAVVFWLIESANSGSDLEAGIVVHNAWKTIGSSAIAGEVLGKFVFGANEGTELIICAGLTKASLNANFYTVEELEEFVNAFAASSDPLSERMACLLFECSPLVMLKYFEPTLTDVELSKLAELELIRVSIINSEFELDSTVAVRIRNILTEFSANQSIVIDGFLATFISALKIFSVDFPEVSDYLNSYRRDGELYYLSSLSTADELLELSNQNESVFVGREVSE